MLLPYYSPPLQFELLSEPANRTRDAQKAAQNVFRLWRQISSLISTPGQPHSQGPLLIKQRKMEDPGNEGESCEY